MKELACGDVVKGCAAVMNAPTEEELMTKVVEHAASAHGVAEVSPELLAQVKAAVRTS
ncbi:MAG: DUF1059 domain-containing protein [Vicinamibacteria bacterium]